MLEVDRIRLKREIAAILPSGCGDFMLNQVIDKCEGAIMRGKVFKHLKRGSTYRHVGDFELQATTPPVEGTIIRAYRGIDRPGRYCRPLAEFMDGRFIEITTTTEGR